MTPEETFSTILAQKAKGVMIHDQLASIFNFLNLHGYKKCHEYHYLSESYDYRSLYDFYLDNYHCLIPNQVINSPQIIPSNWFKHKKEEVDVNTKRAGIKDAVKKWVDWEQETKELLESSYKNLYEENEIFASLKIAKCIEEVGEELLEAQKLLINLDTIGYDISLIVDNQDAIYNKYHKKIKKLYGDDE